MLAYQTEETESSNNVLLMRIDTDMCLKKVILGKQIVQVVKSAVCLLI